ncbi:MAG: DUF4340 domain-containing protein [Gammaproteobacteria bacterium]|nr:DUF4340 domain-containing protein [Gammaproteobacteria bacterium]
MLSRALLNITLLILVVLLAIYVFTSDTKQQEKQTSTLLAPLSPADVDRINIRHNQRMIELNKEDSKWHMLKPISIGANSFRIDTLLKMLESSSHASYPVSDLDLDKYGLDEAATAISFNNRTIEFGIVNPVNGYRYVRSGNNVHLIDDHFYPLISSQTGTLVARELLHSGAVIEKLQLPQHTLYRDKDGSWNSSENLDPDAINEVIYHWQNSQAFGVHNYMQREPLAEIAVLLAGNDQPIRFYVTDTDPWLIIARPDLDIEYHFNLEFYDRLLQPGVATASAAKSGE